MTGGGHGIGRALAERLYEDGVKVVVADIDAAAADAAAAAVDGIAVRTDVGREADIVELVERVEADVGPIDMFVSNAGVLFGDDGSGAASRGGRFAAVEDRWELSWRINVMAHVYAARALVPRMRERGGGYLVNVASAAGLLAQIGDAAYTTTKHAAVGFAESLAITHGEDGIRVAVVCPQAVATRMLELGQKKDGSAGGAAVDGVLAADKVADCIVDGIAAGAFLILPHEEVHTYVQRKASDHDRWIAGMQRLRRKLTGS